MLCLMGVCIDSPCLSRSLHSVTRENVLQFPVIQMANCTRPPALNDKWQKSPFHPSPSLPLGCTLIFLPKVWWKAQLDVWMRAALERVWYRIIQLLQRLCWQKLPVLLYSQVGVQASKPTSWLDKMLSTKISSFCNVMIVGFSPKEKCSVARCTVLGCEEQVCTPNTPVP